MDNPEVVVVGSGPNGLSAAVALAQAGRSVKLFEAAPTIGGGARTAELTLPGFLHDVCSSVHPFGAGSPFFRKLGLESFGLRWIFPEISVAHPLGEGDAAWIAKPWPSGIEQFEEDSASLGRLLAPYVENWDQFASDALGPLRFPESPWRMARFAWHAIEPATQTRRRFATEKTRAVLAGMAAHSMLALDRWMTGGFGLLLWISAYAVGWPFAAGGSQAIAQALAKLLQGLGGEIVTGAPVKSLAELPPARAVLLDVTPRQFLQMAGGRISSRERRALSRYRYGPAAFKVDWALSAPIPWKAQVCRRAGTVHVGGTFDQIALSEQRAWAGKTPERPFLIVAQPSLVDSVRAPAGKHTAWAYCHVPLGATVDLTAKIEAEIERLAPGFGDSILGRHVMGPRELEAHNANLVGGDIGGGSAEISQFFLRPTRRLYSTSVDGVFLCSAATPPGAGVHGMCGYFAAQRALKTRF